MTPVRDRGTSARRTAWPAFLLLAIPPTILHAADEPGKEQSQAEIVRVLTPLSVRGVNYYPAQTPWSGMWTKTPDEVWQRDMRLAASLNINAVRTFLLSGPGLVDAEGRVAPAYLEKFERFLDITWRHGIRVVVCFEFLGQGPAVPEAAWKRTMADFVTPHKDDGRVLMWDLKNEPESRNWDEPVTTYLRSAIPYVKELDPNHLSTVGIAFQVDRLAKIGLPDVIQYHEYAPKDQLFAQGIERISKPVSGMRHAGGTRAVLIGEFGMSTARDVERGAGPAWQEKLPPPPGTEAEQERLYRIVLEAAEKLQLAGVMPWCLHSYPTQERGFLTPVESMFGLVRHDNTLKPAAVLLREYYARWKEERKAGGKGRETRP